MKLAYVIDDSISFQIMMKVQLNHLGYIVKSFYSANEYLAQQLERPNVILLDKHLGEKENGLSYIKEFKARTPGVPIVFLSADHDAFIVAEAMKQGAFTCIEKNSATSVRLRTALDDIPLFVLSQKRSERIKTGAKLVSFVLFVATLIILYQRLVH